MVTTEDQDLDLLIQLTIIELDLVLNIQLIIIELDLDQLMQQLCQATSKALMSLSDGVINFGLGASHHQFARATGVHNSVSIEWGNLDTGCSADW